MKCPNCNGNIPDNSKFCTICGAKIEAAPTSGFTPAGAAAPAGGAASAAAGSVKNVLNNIDFHHFDLKGLITIEAIVWLIPVIGWFVPWMNSSKYAEPTSLFSGLIDNDLGDFGLFLGILILVTILLVVEGFWIASRPVKRKMPVEFGIVGIWTSVMMILLTKIIGIGFGALSAIGAGSGMNLMGQLVKLSSWVLLILSCWQMWMMAGQGKKVN